MSLPSRDQVIEFYDLQPASDKMPHGFVRGSDSRAAYTEWFQDQVGGDSLTTPRGLSREGHDQIREYALYVLERALKARKEKEGVETPCFIVVPPVTDD